VSKADKTDVPAITIDGMKLEHFLAIAQVEAATGLDAKLIYKKMAAGLFPRQVLIKAAPDAKKYSARWLASEIIAWQQARIGERDHAAATGEPAHLPTRLQPPARARAAVTAAKNIADRSKGKRHVESDEAASR
jgi:predicted DNA-binding transcriptional regulator AlpA